MLISRLFSRVVLFTLGALLLVQPAYADWIQNFDTDPQWTRFNNPANDNDFGFQNSDLAGGTAGEVGGFFSRSSVPVWYGDESIGNFGGDEVLSASGILNIRSVDPAYNNNVFIGHFDNDGFSIASQNGIGFQVAESAAQVGTSEFRIFYLAGTSEGLLFTIDGLNVTRTWSYNYDPSAGDFGSLTVSVSGTGGETVTHFLTSGERSSIGSIETFGLAVKPHSGPDSARAEIYVDNLSYTSSLATSSLAIDIKPGREPNLIKCKNKNSVILVAILTTETFDAMTVDHTTVVFEGADETHKKAGVPRRHEKDVDHDGDTDLVFHFRLGDSNLTCDSTVGTLTGQTFDGQAFGGSDNVSMVGG